MPDSPATTFHFDHVTIDWYAPDNAGSPITSYTIFIRTSDMVTYTTELSHCDGSDPTIVADTQCNIPVSVLRAAPFNLPWGNLVYAKIEATNAYGDSGPSDAGCCARLVTNPDPPINLQEVLSGRTISTLGLSWQQGVFNGGDTILDYRVSMADESGVYAYIVENLAATQYVATGLQYGTTYSFKVESRNSYGYSTYSSVFSILCAIEPDTIAAPTTHIDLDKVVVDWFAPNDHGSPITGYNVYILQNDKVTYSEETIDCVGTSSALMSNTSCSISSF